MTFPEVKPSVNESPIAMWAWTGKLEELDLNEQLEEFKEAGYAQVMIYPRYGLETEYLSEEWFGYVKEIVKKASENGMRIWLYDELAFPSGTAGKKVVRENPRLQSQFIYTARLSKGEYERKCLASTDTENIKFHGIIMSGRFIPAGKTGENLKINTPSLAVYKGKNPNYINMFNPEAIEKFIEYTHEEYKKHVGEYFGKTISGIFSDEPSPAQVQHHIYSILAPLEKILPKGYFLPWSEELEEEFSRLSEKSIISSIPQLSSEEYAKEKIIWYEVFGKLFEENFFIKVSKWCEDNGIAMCGHLMGERHTDCAGFNGSMYRHLRHEQIPTVDDIFTAVNMDSAKWKESRSHSSTEKREFFTSKQVEGIAVQTGREEIMNEVFALGPADFTPENMAEKISYELCFGINRFLFAVCHSSMKGNITAGKYFSAFSRQQPWFKRAEPFSAWVAEAASLSRQGKAAPEVFYLYPLQSNSSCFPPAKPSYMRIREYAVEFKTRTVIEDSLKLLLENQCDALCLEEYALKNAKIKGKKLEAGKVSCETVVLPPVKRLLPKTVKILDKFVSSGGKLLAMVLPGYEAWRRLPVTETIELDGTDTAGRRIRESLACVKIDSHAPEEKQKFFIRRRITEKGKIYWIHNGTGKNIENLRLNFSEPNIYSYSFEEKTWFREKNAINFRKGEGKAFFVTSDFLEAPDAKTARFEKIKDLTAEKIEVSFEHPNIFKAGNWKNTEKGKLETSVKISGKAPVKQLCFPGCVGKINVNGRSIPLKNKIKSFFDKFYYSIDVPADIFEKHNKINITLEKEYEHPARDIAENPFLPLLLLLGDFRNINGKILPPEKIKMGDLKAQGYPLYWGKVYYNINPSELHWDACVLEVESQSAGTLSLLINGKTVETKFKAPYCFTPGRISASDKIQLEYTNSIGMMLETPKPEFATRENKAGILSVSLARKSFNN